MKRFLTLFPDAANVHLAKDVGMIPYVLHQHFGYDSTLASYQNGEYLTLNHELIGLKQLFIQKAFRNELLDVLLFLLINSRKFDVLNVYHLVRNSWVSGLFFKVITLNRGKVFLKLDVDDRLFNYQPKGLKKKIFDFIFSKIDLISVESSTYTTYLNENNKLGQSISLIPNGFYNYGVQQTTAFADKENLIITVGRVGSHQKATEVLCDAFVSFAESNKEWRMEVIGPIEKDFQNYILRFHENHPALSARVTFVGEITDRETLYHYYKRAKIFALTSRWEGFPIVFPEAIHHGCYVIATNLPAAQDITGNGQYGKLFPVDDVESLTLALEEACQNQDKLALNCQQVQIFASRKFSWVSICSQINNLLK